MNWKTLLQTAVIFGTVLIADSAFATTWHVRSTAACANNGNGTSSSCAASAGAAGAWRDLSNINWASVAAGDSVLLYGGDTYTTQMTVGASGSGTGATFTSPITISVENTSNGTNPAIIDATSISAGAPIEENGKAYIIVDGLYGCAAGPLASSICAGGNTNYGLKIINASGTSANPAGCVKDTSGGGPFKVFHVDCSGTGGDSGTDNANAGIWENSSSAVGFEFAYNWVHGTYTGSTFSLRWHLSGITWCPNGHGGSSTGYTDGIIHDNKVEYVYWDGIDSGGNNASIYNNETDHIEGSTHSDSLNDNNGAYVQIYNNFAHDSGDQAIYFDDWTGNMAHVRIYNNVVASVAANGSTSLGIIYHAEDPSGSINDIVIANNTIYNVDQYGIRKGGNSTSPGPVTNAVFLNNIVGAATGAFVTGDTPMEFTNGNVSFLDANAWDYNVYPTSIDTNPYVANDWSGCTGNGAASCTIPQLQALATPREVHGQLATPTYVSAPTNFQLAGSDTVARGHGRNLYSTYTFLQTDHAGNARPSTGAWDVGAYQSSSTAPPAPAQPMLLGVLIK